MNERQVTTIITQLTLDLAEANKKLGRMEALLDYLDSERRREYVDAGKIMAILGFEFMPEDEV